MVSDPIIGPADWDGGIAITLAYWKNRNKISYLK